MKADPEMVVADRYVWWGVLGKCHRKGLVRLGLRSVRDAPCHPRPPHVHGCTR